MYISVNYTIVKYCINMKWLRSYLLRGKYTKKIPIALELALIYFRLRPKYLQC